MNLQMQLARNLATVALLGTVQTVPDKQPSTAGLFVQGTRIKPLV